MKDLILMQGDHMCLLEVEQIFQFLLCQKLLQLITDGSEANKSNPAECFEDFSCNLPFSFKIHIFILEIKVFWKFCRMSFCHVDC